MAGPLKAGSRRDGAATARRAAPSRDATSGRQAAPAGQDLTPADLLQMYRTMVLSRALDERVYQLNRGGKAAIFGSAQGHEAAQAGCIRATDPARDHYLIYYRQLTAMLALGTTSLEMLLAFLAREGEPMSQARQFPLHGAHPRVDLFSFSNVVATQVPQGVGVALADKMRRSDAVTVVFFGDGAASQGDTHEGMNFAGVHKLPVVFFCENNRFAISVPLRKQMAIENVSARAAGYGFPGVTVDGTDMIAVYEVVKEAVARARAGKGPALVEAMVYRLLPHTTDDDHTRYLSKEELEHMRREGDPLPKTARMLRERGLLTGSEEAAVLAEARRTVNEATEKAEAAPFPPAGEMFKHVYAESPSPGAQSTPSPSGRSVPAIGGRG
jgi:2-oxoisovalerate dehydrogenase E1 component alpha subunit